MLRIIKCYERKIIIYIVNINLYFIFSLLSAPQQLTFGAKLYIKAEGVATFLIAVN